MVLAGIGGAPEVNAGEEMCVCVGSGGGAGRKVNTAASENGISGLSTNRPSAKTCQY